MTLAPDATLALVIIGGVVVLVVARVLQRLGTP